MKTFVWVLTTHDSTGNISSGAYGSLAEAADMMRSIYAPDGSLDNVPNTLLAERIEQTGPEIQFTLERQQIELPDVMPAPGMHRWMRASDVLAAVTQAEDDILDAAGLEEGSGTGQALNLMGNAVYDYLFNPAVEKLEDVVLFSYEDTSLDEVIDWVVAGR